MNRVIPIDDDIDSAIVSRDMDQHLGSRDVSTPFDMTKHGLFDDRQRRQLPAPPSESRRRSFPRFVNL